MPRRNAFFTFSIFYFHVFWGQVHLDCSLHNTVPKYLEPRSSNKDKPDPPDLPRLHLLYSTVPLLLPEYGGHEVTPHSSYVTMYALAVPTLWQSEARCCGPFDQATARDILHHVACALDVTAHILSKRGVTQREPSHVVGPQGIDLNSCRVGRACAHDVTI